MESARSGARDPASPARAGSLRVSLPGLLAVVWLAFALLSVIRLPLAPLWLPTLVASSWAHLWLLLSLGILLLARRVRRRRARRAGEPESPGRRRSRIDLLLGLAILTFAIPVARQARAWPQWSESVAFIGDRETATRRFPTLRDETHAFAEREGGELLLDLIAPAPTDAPLPVVIVIHGGAWERGSRAEFRASRRELAQLGFAVLSIDYRLAPAHRFPAPMEDIDAAIDFVARRGGALGLDPGRIALLGRSAGGHLALTAAYRRPDAVRGVIAYYAPTDLPWSWETSVDRTYLDGRALTEALMGSPPSQDPERWRAASPIHLAEGDSPPTLLLQGTRDRLVSPRHSTRLRQRLEELGVPCWELRIPGGTHGFDVARSGLVAAIEERALRRFLAATLH